MPITASQLFNSSGSWLAPPGYSGPVLVSGFAGSIGSLGSNCAGIFTTSAGISYNVNPHDGSFGGNFISQGTTCNSLTVTWWPGCAAHQYFMSGVYNWHSPPGHNGPVLFYSQPYMSGTSFDHIGIGVNDGFSHAGNTVVLVASVTDGSDHAIYVSGSWAILVWFP